MAECAGQHRTRNSGASRSRTGSFQLTPLACCGRKRSPLRLGMANRWLLYVLARSSVNWSLRRSQLRLQTVDDDIETKFEELIARTINGIGDLRQRGSGLTKCGVGDEIEIDLTRHEGVE